MEEGDMIPDDGDVIEGVAWVDKSAITGESAPVIHESGGDRSAVTGGTRVLSDWIVVQISANPGETFLDRMIALVEGAKHKSIPLPANASQQAFVGAHLEGSHRPLMGLLHSHALPARHLPPAQSAVTASTDHHLPTWDPAQRRDHPRMPHKDMHRLSAVGSAAGIPHEQLPAVCLPLAAAT